MDGSGSSRSWAACGPQHREALVETYLHGRTAAEISARQGLPVGTIKSRVHYALRAAREAIAA